MHMPVIAFIANPKSAHGPAMLKLIGELEGRASFIVGNDLPTLQRSDQLGDVDVIVFVHFAAGAPVVIKELWPHCPKVRWVHNMVAGVDAICSIINALPGGPEIPLTCGKGAFTGSVAEFVLGAMLHFIKQVPQLQKNRECRTWEPFTVPKLHGKTVGFVGFGDIAQATAHLCKAFGMRVLALRRRKGLSGSGLADAVYHYSDVEGNTGTQKLFAESDFVVCSLPGGKATDKFCGKAEFAAMKAAGVFISVGRGTCVDEAALVEALRSEKMAGAALDVVAVEPLPAESPLWTCPNLLLSPHTQFNTTSFMRDAWNVFMDRLGEFSQPDFQCFADTVDKEGGY